MRRRRGRPQRLLLCACVLLVAEAAACASAWTPVRGADGARLFNRKLGFSLVRPNGLAEVPRGVVEWEETSVAGSSLAYRRADGSRMSVLTECDRGVTQAKVRARQLLYGISERSEIDAKPVAIAGSEAWVQKLLARDGDGEVVLKTVTIVDGSCTIDWVLVQPRAAQSAERLFDHWWSSYRRSASGADDVEAAAEREAPPAAGEGDA